MKSRPCRRRRAPGSLLQLLSLFLWVAAVRARRPPNPPPSSSSSSSSSPAAPDFFFSLSVDLSSDGDESDGEELFVPRFSPPAAAAAASRASSDSVALGGLPPPAGGDGKRNTGAAGTPQGELFLNGRTRGYGGCYISAQALMCQGGGGRGGENRSDGDDDEDDDDEEDNDENGNDDDGHSSMLSNLSLRRSRGPRLVVPEGSAAAAASPGGYSREKSESSAGSAAAAAAGGGIGSSGAAVAPLGTALSLRGGAAGGGASGLLRSQAARNLLVTALVTLLFEGSIGHILEFLKIVKQTALTDVSYLQVLRDITRSKGLAGLWDGFLPWGVVQAVFKGAVFGLAYQAAVDAVRHLDRCCGVVLPPTLALALAGGLGGAAQGYVLSPTLLLKTRVMTNPAFREKMSAWRTTWLSFQIGFEICAAESLGALMKGSNIFALKRVFDWSSRYLFSDMFESLFSLLKGGAAPLTVAERSAASMLGGVLSTCVTLPLDVLVAKTQDAKKAGVRVPALKLFRDELSDRGWSGLQKSYMQGFEARLLHVCLTTVVIKTLTPIAYRLLFPVQS